MLLQPLGHFLAATELCNEVGVKPRLVDAQLRVGHQAVAVEALDVVALVGRTIAPDIHTIFAHGAYQQGAGDGAAQWGGVEVGLAAGADVESAASKCCEAFFNQSRLAVNQTGVLCAVLQCTARYCVDIWLIVLAEVASVGVRDGALVAHPGYCHRGVEATGERDTYALAYREIGKNFRHVSILMDKYAMQ